MGPTRKRDLAGAVVVMAVVGYFAFNGLFGAFPPITIWTGLSLLVAAAAEGGWAFYVRAKIGDGRIGVGSGRLHPLSVARSLVVAKASAWVGAVACGWWVGVLVVVLRRHELRAAAAATPGTVVAAVSAFALVVAALWLQHCCKSPGEPPEHPDGLPQ